DNRIRPAEEVRRKRAADIRRPRFACDVTGIELQQGIANTGARRKSSPCTACSFQQLLGLLVGLGQQDVRPVDDLLRRRLPAVTRARVTVIVDYLGDDLERRVGDAEAEVMACGELAGFAAGSQGIGRRMGLLRGTRPDRDGAEMEMTALPAEGLRLGPRLEDQLHPLGGALPRLGRVEV